MRTRLCSIVVVSLILLSGPARVMADVCSPGPDNASRTVRVHLETPETPEAISSLTETADALAARLQACGIENPSIRVVGTDLDVEVPASWDLQGVAQLLGQQALVELREQRTVDGRIAWVPALGQALDGSLVPFDDARFARASLIMERATGRPLIEFELDADSTVLLASVTERLIGRQLGLFVDGEPVMTPTVQAPINNGIGQISGGFSLDEARTLVAQLSSGPLPTPVWIEPIEP